MSADSGKIKIAKFLADCGVGSRRKCEEIIEEGRVKVNGRVMDNVAERIDPLVDRVKLAGRVLRPLKHAVFAMHKPRGYVCTMSDPKAGKTIVDLIPEKYSRMGLKPVGRLDKESEGLLILTNDGALANLIMHPRYGLEKTYRVSIDKPVTRRVINILARGIRLPNGIKLRPFQIRIAGKGPDASRMLEIRIGEGKKREIRKAFAVFGYEVTRLIRISIGPLKLGAIRKGQMVQLSDKQLQGLKKRLKTDGKKLPRTKAGH